MIKISNLLCCVYLIAPVWSSFQWGPGEFFLLLFLQSIRLTAACWLLAQLQPIDGQSVGSSAQVALLSFTLHVALALWNVGRLDLVTTVALGSELQPCVHVTSGGERKRIRIVSKGSRQVGVTALSLHYVSWSFSGKYRLSFRVTG